MVRNVEVILEDILRSIDWIGNDIGGVNQQQFLDDRPTRQVVERNLEIISEASRRIPADMKDGYFQIPWQDIASIGNILRHDYHDIRPMIIWKIVQNDLPALRLAIIALLAGQRRS